jgi:hypothetical protein
VGDLDNSRLLVEIAITAAGSTVAHCAQQGHQLLHTRVIVRIVVRP